MSMDLASLKPLIHAVIPEEGQFFDVNVTLAASPSNFTVSRWFSVVFNLSQVAESPNPYQF